MLHIFFTSVSMCYLERVLTSILTRRYLQVYTGQQTTYIFLASQWWAQPVLKVTSTQKLLRTHSCNLWAEIQVVKIKGVERGPNTTLILYINTKINIFMREVSERLKSEILAGSYINWQWDQCSLGVFLYILYFKRVT